MSKRSFIRYARKIDIDPQSIYFDSSIITNVVPELRARGTRRILIVCDPVTRKYKIFEDMLTAFLEQGFRVFAYKRTDGQLTTKDIVGGLKIYNDYNCDTIVSVGGTAEIDCAKLIAVLAANPEKSLSTATGTDKFKNDIKTLCCIVSDNSASASTASAEYYSEETHKWETVLSPFLVPHVVVFDSEFSSRVPLETAVSSSLTALCLAIEAYTSPVADYFPEYRANAVVAITKIFGTIDKMYKKPTDSYIRKQISAGGFYAGLSSRKTGIGYAHIIMHCFVDKYNVPHGTGYCRILQLILKASLDKEKESLAILAREAHFCTMSIDTTSAAQSFIESITRLYQRVGGFDVIPHINEEDIDSIVAETEKEAVRFGLNKTIDTNTLRQIIAILASQS